MVLSTRRIVSVTESDHVCPAPSMHCDGIGAMFRKHRYSPSAVCAGPKAGGPGCACSLICFCGDNPGAHDSSGCRCCQTCYEFEAVCVACSETYTLEHACAEGFRAENTQYMRKE